MVKYYLGYFQNKNKLNPCAWSIRIGENRDTSHVEVLRVECGDWDNAVSFGSVFRKSRKIGLQEIKVHYELKKIIPLYIKIPVAGSDELLINLLDKYYSFVQILLAGTRIVLGAGNPWLDKAKPNLSKHLICTELAGIFMQEACQYRFETSPELLTLAETEEIAFAYSPKD